MFLEELTDQRRPGTGPALLSIPFNSDPCIEARERSCEAPGAGGAADRPTRLARASDMAAAARRQSRMKHASETLAATPDLL